MILTTLRKYAKLIKWGGIILLVLGVAYSIYDYAQSKEQLAQLELNNDQLETRIESLKQNVEQQSRQLNQLNKDYNIIELEYTQQIEQLNELRQLTKDYIQSNQPKVEQQLNDKFDQTIKQVQCLSGDRSKCES